MTNETPSPTKLFILLTLVLFSLMPVIELHAEGDLPNITSLQLSVGEDGNCTLKVDSRDTEEAHKRDEKVKGEEIKLEAFGDAKVNKLDDGRLNVIYDFATIKDATQLFPSFLNDQAKKQLGQSISIDEDEGVLVLTPANNKRVNLPLPRMLRPPFTVRIDLLGHSEGMFQLTASPGGNLIATSLHGSKTPEKSASVGDIRVISRSANSKQLNSLLKVNHQKAELRDYHFKVDPEAVKNNAMLGIGYFGDLPIAVKKIEITAKIPPSFGIALKQVGTRIIAQQVVDGSAAQKAGIRKNDVIVAIGDKKAKSAKDALNSFSECELGKEVVLKVQRYGKDRAIKVIPQ
ncbi:PDZ domain-containing protein [Gimesia benthica]|uniref:PDZ domain-containing protein n=1 Tax=Gimesia benthica TaxID=2608982 RepID=A0A6I6A6G8_9PLAN|nr:PDZ domain-containing protein [Gimesia benthica]QGQ22004.1 PDZ domain-containing protein [Gimesia benthica]